MIFCLLVIDACQQWLHVDADDGSGVKALSLLLFFTASLSLSLSPLSCYSLFLLQNISKNADHCVDEDAGRQHLILFSFFLTITKAASDHLQACVLYAVISILWIYMMMMRPWRWAWIEISLANMLSVLKLFRLQQVCVCVCVGCTAFFIAVTL